MSQVLACDSQRSKCSGVACCACRVWSLEGAWRGREGAQERPTGGVSASARKRGRDRGRTRSPLGSVRSHPRCLLRDPPDPLQVRKQFVRRKFIPPANRPDGRWNAGGGGHSIDATASSVAQIWDCHQGNVPVCRVVSNVKFCQSLADLPRYCLPVRYTMGDNQTRGDVTLLTTMVETSPAIK